MAQRGFPNIENKTNKQNLNKTLEKYDTKPMLLVWLY